MSPQVLADLRLVRGRGLAQRRGPVEPRADRPRRRDALAPGDRGQRPDRARGRPRRHDVVELPGGHVGLPGVRLLARGEAPARELGAVEQEAVAARGHERGLRVVGGLRPVGEQQGPRRRARHPERAGVEVLLLRPAVERCAALVDPRVDAPEPMKRLAGRSGEGVGHPDHAGARRRAGAHVQRAAAVRGDGHDQHPPRGVRGRDDHPDAAAGDAARGAHRARPVDRPGAHGREQVPRPRAALARGRAVRSHGERERAVQRPLQRRPVVRRRRRGRRAQAQAAPRRAALAQHRTARAAGERDAEGRARDDRPALLGDHRDRGPLAAAPAAGAPTASARRTPAASVAAGAREGWWRRRRACPEPNRRASATLGGPRRGPQAGGRRPSVEEPQQVLSPNESDLVDAPEVHRRR